MDREYFLNAGIPPPLHVEPSLSQSPVPTWQTQISAPDPNWSSDPPSNYFLNPNWEKSTDHYAHLESALSSLVSSPASNSAVSGDCFAIRELIGKLGSICNAGEISPSLLAASVATPSYIVGGNNSTNTSCYNTPLNSPPKLHVPNINHFVKENIPNLGNSMPFYNNEFQHRYMGSANLQRVSSSPSLEAGGTLMGVQEKKNCTQIRMEMRSANGLVMDSDKKLSKLSGSGANSNDESSVSEQIPCGETGLRSSNDLNSRKRKAVSRGKVKEAALSQSSKATKEAGVDDDNSNAKRSKTTDASENENGRIKTVEDTKESTNGAADEGQTQANAISKPPESPKDYIHVRARRGQATDSHSLAERVRREKISERMKLLQDIVPGCNKVTGKALMLDEIINYVQSLQRQVEFLSMKLASVDRRLDFNMDSLVSKDILQPDDTSQHPVYPVDSSTSAFYGHQPQQNPQVHVDPLDATLCRNLGMQLPSVDGFGEGLPRFPAFCEDDLQSIVQMGYGNPNGDTTFLSQSFTPQIKHPHMKIEC